jgi:hypothetical protein
VGFLFYDVLMSFGLLKHFKDQKKSYQQQNDVLFFKNIIFGSDLSAILKLLELRKDQAHESIKLLTPRLINRQLLIENYQYGVSQIRSAEAVTEIYKSHFNAKIIPQKESPQFYKDGKFHDFGGRAKSMELTSGEDFFINKSFRLDISSLFSSEEWTNLDEIINQHIDIRIIEGIDKTDAQDLVDKREWLLTFKDFNRIACENLYLSIAPKKFLNCLKNKDSMSADMINFCSSTKNQAALSLTWVLNKDFGYDDRTLLVPQSMTHEWGHFIVEFESFNHQEKTQLCHGLFLIHEEEPQSEDLASKIKLMKRVLDRVFPDFEKHLQKESIRFDEEMFISGVNDQLNEQLSFDYPSLKFLGQAAPMKQQFADEKFLARVLLS